MSKQAEFSIRFGVRAESSLSSRVWKLWVIKNDIYLCERESGKIFKTSLHQSGKWQISLLSEFIAKLNIPNQSRHLEQWLRPPHIKGVTLAYRVLIPESELRKYILIPEESKPIEWIKAPEKGYYSEFDILYTKPETIVSDWPGKNYMNTFLLKKTVLENRETLWVVYRYEKMSEANAANLEKYRGKLKNYKHKKALLIGREPDGSRTFIEIALDS